MSKIRLLLGTKHFHSDKTLPQITKHLLGWKTLARKEKKHLLG